MNDIDYRVEVHRPGAHVFRVQLRVAHPAAAGQIFSLPAWIPGSYMIRDFARHIIALRAHCRGAPVSLQKLDKQRWRAPPVDGPLSLEYEVYAWDLSVRAAHLDTTHGFFNGSSLLLCVEGSEQLPQRLHIARPALAVCEGWQVATAMPALQIDDDGFGDYRAADYSELIDHPVEMGRFERHHFEACGVPHELVLTGTFRSDGARICRDLTRICEQHIRFFGEPAPMDRYVFLVMVVGDGYGGLEHRASTSLLVSRDSLPAPGDSGISDAYLEFLGLCSHEYFHTWNVKRIKPAAFIPERLDREVHSELLWAFEGITSYYDDLALVRCGLISEQRYLELLGRTATRVQRGAGRLKQSIAESSFDAWTKFYKQDENAPNAIVSYYTKGALAALVLDLTIRRDSAGEYSLDDLMRALWERHGKTGKGVAERGVQALATQITGLDLDDFFAAAVHGTTELPLESLLAEFGVALGWRAATSQEDRGGSGDLGATPPLWLGARLQPADGCARISHVFDDGPAQRAGLAAGDLLLAADGLRITPQKLPALLRRYAEGERLALHVFRRDELMAFAVELQRAPRDSCVLTALPEEAGLRRDWLGGGSAEANPTEEASV